MNIRWVMLFPVVGKTKAPHIVGLLFALESTMTFNRGKSKTTPQNGLEWLSGVFLQKSRKSFALKMRVKLPAVNSLTCGLVALQIVLCLDNSEQMFVHTK